MRYALPMLALFAFATPAMASEPEPRKEDQPEAEQPTDEQPKKICRYVQMELGSRRKEKVCLTKEEWRRFNEGN